MMTIRYTIYDRHPTDTNAGAWLPQTIRVRNIETARRRLARLTRAHGRAMSPVIQPGDRLWYVGRDEWTGEMVIGSITVPGKW